MFLGEMFLDTIFDPHFSVARYARIVEFSKSSNIHQMLDTITTDAKETPLEMEINHLKKQNPFDLLKKNLGKEQRQKRTSFDIIRRNFDAKKSKSKFL